MNVGLSSCSNSSTTPIELIRLNEGSLVLRFMESGDAERTVLDLSDVARMGIMEGTTGVETVPRARLTVLM